MHNIIGSQSTDDENVKAKKYVIQMMNTYGLSHLSDEFGTTQPEMLAGKSSSPKDE